MSLRTSGAKNDESVGHANGAWSMEEEIDDPSSGKKGVCHPNTDRRDEKQKIHSNHRPWRRRMSSLAIPLMIYNLNNLKSVKSVPSEDFCFNWLFSLSFCRWNEAIDEFAHLNWHAQDLIDRWKMLGWWSNPVQSGSIIAPSNDWQPDLRIFLFAHNRSLLAFFFKLYSVLTLFWFWFCIQRSLSGYFVMRIAIRDGSTKLVAEIISRMQRTRNEMCWDDCWLNQFDESMICLDWSRRVIHKRIHRIH